MKEFVISEAKAETAVLVGLITQQQDEAKTKEYLDELEFLADTAGAVTVKRFTQKVQGPSQGSPISRMEISNVPPPRSYTAMRSSDFCLSMP